MMGSNEEVKTYGNNEALGSHFDDGNTPKLSQRLKVPALKQLCLLTICGKIERYPPEAFAMLSPLEWDTIIERRWQATAPKKKKTVPSPGALDPLTASDPIKDEGSSSHGGRGLYGTGRMIPALNAQCLREIEDENEHLAESEVADRLVWKDCVEYHFPNSSGEFSRPKILRLPWPLLVQSLQEAGESLTKCWQHCVSDDASHDDNDNITLHQTKKEVQAALHTLLDAPMTISLLSDCGIGKVVTKLVKHMRKRKERGALDDSLKPAENYMLFGNEEGTPTEKQTSQSTCITKLNCTQRTLSDCPLSSLQDLLDGWKLLASSKDANSSASMSLDAISGQGRRTSDAQHTKDLANARKCHTWRQLFATLEERQKKKKNNMSELLRKKRENLKMEQLKTKTCYTVTRSGGERSKRELILSKERGLRNLAAAAARGTRSLEAAIGSKNKISLLRAETKVQANFSKAGSNAGSKLQALAAQPASRFGCSIASSGPKKRAAGEVSFGSGKKMKLPDLQNVNKAKKGIQMTKEVKAKGTRGAFMKRR